MQSNKSTVIMLTGGHGRATAYAVIQEIKKRHKNWRLYWIGTREVLPGKKIESLESNFFPKIGIDFLPIKVARIPLKLDFLKLLNLFKIPVGFFQSLDYLIKFKPKLLVSFGGFAAYPPVVASWLLKIPVIIHEQTSVVGRANFYSGFFATRVAISYQESFKYFKRKKTVLTGNPVSSEVLSIKSKDPNEKPRTIFVTGGASGSTIINNTITLLLEKLLGDFKIIHQTGEYQFGRFKAIKEALPNDLKNNYSIYPVILPSEWYKSLEIADIVISRSGANIVSELMVAKRPSILIPLSIAFRQEQLENALKAREFGVARILEEKNLTSESLYSELLELKKDWSKVVLNLKNKKPPNISSSKKFVDLIENLTQHEVS